MAFLCNDITCSHMIQVFDHKCTYTISFVVYNYIYHNLFKTNNFGKNHLRKLLHHYHYSKPSNNNIIYTFPAHNAIEKERERAKCPQFSHSVLSLHITCWMSTISCWRAFSWRPAGPSPPWLAVPTAWHTQLPLLVTSPPISS